MKFAVITAAGLLLTACSGISFDSNLNPAHVKDYYKPSMVQTVSYDELKAKPYLDLGMVKGLSCQLRPDAYPATEAEARTELKRNAADLKANAVVLGKCVRTENTPACVASVTCYGDALYVDPKAED